MGVPVNTVASGGLPVVDVTATTKMGMPVSETVAVGANKYGTSVTKVASGGLAVVYVVPPP
jgi:hypothetical protein